ncbi:hypothetical protein ROZALSC1DRAFT_27296 [Rozella allomycis CSF55]|uniref:Protein kinase domain-containing protein n=1 Tax=Rozella allomycis (strain CSF55) TaxID=988480 RepID=A0A4P9YNI5_ROZAC|nr:hypothetical protein ROZALSC1DRAFT_27296 [Rozella allomycis CSF55]
MKFTIIISSIALLQLTEAAPFLPLALAAGGGLTGGILYNAMADKVQSDRHESERRYQQMVTFYKAMGEMEKVNSSYRDKMAELQKVTALNQNKRLDNTEKTLIQNIEETKRIGQQIDTNLSTPSVETDTHSSSTGQRNSAKISADEMALHAPSAAASALRNTGANYDPTYSAIQQSLPSGYEVQGANHGTHGLTNSQYAAMMSQESIPSLNMFAGVHSKVDIMLIPNSAFSLNLVNGVLYLFGGLSNDGPLSSLLELNISTHDTNIVQDTKALWSPIPRTQGPETKNKFIYDHRCVNNDVSMFCLGGEVSKNTTERNLMVFDSNKNEWNLFNWPIKARKKHAMVLVDKTIFVHGGLVLKNDSWIATNELITIDYSSLFIKIYKNDDGPSFRHDHAYATDGKYLYLHGGNRENNTLLADFWRYEITNDKWDKMDSILPSLSGHVMTNVEDKWLVVTGGVLASGWHLSDKKTVPLRNHGAVYNTKKKEIIILDNNETLHRIDTSGIPNLSFNLFSNQPEIQQVDDESFSLFGLSKLNSIIILTSSCGILVLFVFIVTISNRTDDKRKIPVHKLFSWSQKKMKNIPHEEEIIQVKPIIITQNKSVSPTPPLVGRIIKEQYVVTGRNMQMVNGFHFEYYDGESLNDNSRVLIKVFKNECSFYRELEIFQILKTKTIVMMRILSYLKVTKLQRELALCLQDCHDTLIAHLNISLDSFVLCDGAWKISAFECARIIPCNEPIPLGHKHPHYLPPEALRSMMKQKIMEIDLSIDIWSLGVLFYRLTTDRKFLHELKIDKVKFISELDQEWSIIRNALR